jgi:hypothetical protein
MTKKTGNNVYSGHYTIAKRKKDSDVSEIVADFDNLITTFGITLDNAGGFWRPTYCALGTGTTAPAASNLQLEQPVLDGSGQLAWTYVNWNGTPTPIQETTFPYEYKISAVANFTPGIVSGNLTEIGLYQGDPQTGEMKVFSRALIKDTNGNPTTLTVANDEYLDVYYYLKTSFSPINQPFSININGVARTGRVRSFIDKENVLLNSGKPDLFQKPGVISFCTGKLDYADVLGSWPSLFQTYGSAFYDHEKTYVPGNKFVDFYRTLIPAEGVVSFDTIVVGHNPVHIYEFDQAVTKSASESLTISFRYNWDKV